MNAGIAGPVVVARSAPDRIASIWMTYTPSTGRMLHRGAGAFVQSGRPSADCVVDGVSGCLMLVRREVFATVGLLDEDYFFSFEDLDFCLRARRAGFATVLASAATVYHEGGQSLAAASPRRLYYAARDHLLLGERADPSSGVLSSALRTSSILTLNLAHAVRSSGGGLPARLWGGDRRRTRLSTRRLRGQLAVPALRRVEQLRAIRPGGTGLFRVEALAHRGAISGRV